MGILDEMLEGKKSIVILGHVNPDGDCIGSCLGLYNYLKENYEGLEVSVYLEKMGVKFSYLSGYMADKYDEDADTCQARAHSRMQNSVSSELSASALSAFAGMPLVMDTYTHTTETETYDPVKDDSSSSGSSTDSDGFGGSSGGKF